MKGEESNPYAPMTATIKDVRTECGGERTIKTFEFLIDDEEKREDFDYKPGQFAMISVFGIGEAPFAISAPPIGENLQITVMKTGKLTEELHTMGKGEKIGIRGPYGNHFPVEDWKGKDLVFIGAGIGIAPLRSVYGYVMDDKHRDEFGDVELIYGARSTSAMAYRDELEDMACRDDLAVYRCVDWEFGDDGVLEKPAEKSCTPIDFERPEESDVEPGEKYTAFVPQLVKAVKPDPENSIAMTCGPPVAINLTVEALTDFDWRPEQIYTTLENRMKCGIGKCGRCNIGSEYVCKDGPVYNYQELKNMKPEHEVTEGD